MKFSNIALFATGALALKPIYREAGLVERQSAAAVDSDIASIITATNSLDTAIKGFSGAADAQSLISASNAVVAAIKKGTSDAAASPAFTQPQALALVSPIQSLAAVVHTTVTDLINQKPKFEAAGLCGQVLEQVQAQQSAATDFQNTVISKVPTVLQPTAQGLAAPIVADLGTAANAFKSCPNSPSTSTGSSSSSTPATSIPAYTTSSSSTPAGSVAPTTSCPETTTTAVSPPPYTTGVVPTPSSNGTAPTVSTGSPTPTIIPSNGGAKQVVGFGGLIMAAVVAIAI